MRIAVMLVITAIIFMFFFNYLQHSTVAAAITATLLWIGGTAIGTVIGISVMVYFTK